MFWYLLLAHFIGDYPLQSDWMVANRNKARVRLLHGTIHLAVMLLFTFPISLRVWTWLLIVSALHMSIDFSKGWLSARRPRWNRWLYVVDQALHYLILAGLSVCIGPSAAEQLPIPGLVVLLAIGFLLVSYIWMISERVLFAGQPGASEMHERAVPRAWVRCGLLAIVLLGWYAVFPVSLAILIHFPYPANRIGIRALVIDVLVIAIVAFFVVLAGG